MTTATDYTKIAAFDLQAHINSCSDEEKIRLFRQLPDGLQEKEADGMWLKNHDSYHYSTELKVRYITNHYVKLIDSLFDRPEIDDGSATIVFTYASGRERQVATITDWCVMPRDYLIKMTMKSRNIAPNKVTSHIFLG